MVIEVMLANDRTSATKRTIAYEGAALVRLCFCFADSGKGRVE